MAEIHSNKVQPLDNGELPDGWKYIPIGELASIKYGKAKPKADGSCPVVGSGGIYGLTAAPLVDFPTIVVGRKGTAGTAWLLESPCWPSDTTFYLDWANKPVDIEFVFRYLQYRPLSGDHAKTTLPSLQKADLENYQIPFPPLPEQKAIAHVLRTVQQAKQATEKVIAATRQLKQSLMKHLFTYGPVPFDQADKVELKETETGQVPEHWTVKKFEEIATLQRGQDLPRYDFKSGDIPVIGATSIIGYHNEFNVRGPGVTVVRSGSSAGLPLYIDRDFWAHNVVLYVKDFHGNDAKFTYYRLLTLQLTKYRGGVAVPTLNRNTFRNLNVAVPSIVEQKQIVALLDAVDIAIGQREKKRDALGILFETLLHYLMTGKVRVPFNTNQAIAEAV